MLYSFSHLHFHNIHSLDPDLLLCFSLYRGIGPLAIAFPATSKLSGAFGNPSISPDSQAATAERLPLSVPVPL